MADELYDNSARVIDLSRSWHGLFVLIKFAKNYVRKTFLIVVLAIGTVS